MLERRGGVKQRSILFGQYQIAVVAVPMDGGKITFNVNGRAFTEGGQSFSSLLVFDSLGRAVLFVNIASRRMRIENRSD
jgi:hypothetical protein